MLVTKILQARKTLPGEIYVIETTRVLSSQIAQRLDESLQLKRRRPIKVIHSDDCAEPNVGSRVHVKFRQVPVYSSVNNDVVHTSFYLGRAEQTPETAVTLTTPRTLEKRLESLYRVSRRKLKDHLDESQIRALRYFLSGQLTEEHRPKSRARPVDGAKTAGEKWAELVNGTRKRRWPQKVWSPKEVEQLVTRRKQSWSLKTIAKTLRVTREQTKRALRKLGTVPFEGHLSATAAVVEHVSRLDEQACSHEADALFEMRFQKIWQALMESPMTECWSETIRGKTSAEWKGRIAEHILPEAKALLAQERCPTFEELRTLPERPTSMNAGVYAQLVESQWEIQIPTDRLVYVGSATRYGGGLSGRMHGHLSKYNASRLQDMMKRRGLERRGTFATLLEMGMTSSNPEDIWDVRTTVVLAEAILTVWLGALKSPSPILEKAFPWAPNRKDYSPWSLHNPLEVDVTRPQPQISDAVPSRCPAEDCPNAAEQTVSIELATENLTLRGLLH